MSLRRRRQRLILGVALGVVALAAVALVRSHDRAHDRIRCKELCDQAHPSTRTVYIHPGVEHEATRQIEASEPFQKLLTACQKSQKISGCKCARRTIGWLVLQAERVSPRWSSAVSS